MFCSTTAHDIAKLSLEEQTNMKERNHTNGTEKNIKELSADDFLPIFIYCFVQAELLRPSALCKFFMFFFLLHSLFC